MFRPVPARKNNIKSFEGKYRIIRSIFLRLSSADPNVHDAIYTVTAVRISNDLYGNDVTSAYGFDTGHTRLIDEQL